MELKLYNRLRTELLKTLAAASERHDPAYQKAVEGYAPEAESGVAKWARDAIQGWFFPAPDEEVSDAAEDVIEDVIEDPEEFLDAA